MPEGVFFGSGEVEISRPNLGLTILQPQWHPRLTFCCFPFGLEPVVPSIHCTTALLCTFHQFIKIPAKSKPVAPPAWGP